MRGGGRGGRSAVSHYKSLDDVAAAESQGALAQQVTYEDDSDRRPQKPHQQQTQKPAYNGQPQYQPPYQQQHQYTSGSSQSVETTQQFKGQSASGGTGNVTGAPELHQYY